MTFHNTQQDSLFEGETLQTFNIAV
jgi:hypothetical protein